MQVKGAGRIFVHALAVLLAVAYLIPVYMTIITSLKAPAEISHFSAWSVPHTPNWESYSIAFRKFAPYLKNSFILAIAATLLSAAMGAVNGYVLSKYPFPGSRVVMPVIVFGMFIPYQSILVPLFQFLQSIRLYGGLPGLILVHVVYGLP
ncbi:MAG TPA: ABC transporter permease, partial [Firmicutes bacterium]|nr:ABC transporter permease [Bacillota bacterium]